MPLVPKIDPNKIFASNAPTQDKPAAFDNYEKGMDETRKNLGRPTIPQLNYLHQTADQKILWIHQNGGGLPYDASIEYAENAVTLKDGELKQLVDGAWVEVKPKALPATAITTASSQNQQQINDFGGAKWYAKVGGYELGATVKLANGDTVQSTKSANTANPNVDMTGWKKSTVDADALKQYATLALATADIANIALNKNVFVSEAANGGYWYKATAGATSLTKSPYDPLTQAKSYFANIANARVVGSSTGNINYTTSDRTLTFSNTVYVLSPTNVYTIATPQAIVLATNTIFRIEFNVSTRAIRSVAHNAAKTDGWLVLGFVDVSSSGIETRDFDFQLNGSIKENQYDSAKIVTTTVSNINYTTVDRKLTFANTVYVITDKKLYSLATPQALDLPSNTVYRIEYNTVTNQLRAVIVTAVKAIDWFICAYVTASDTGIATNDFDFRTNEVNSSGFEIGKLLTTTHLTLNLSTDTGFLIMRGNGRIVSNSRSVASPEASVELPPTSGSYRVEYNTYLNTVEINLSALAIKQGCVYIGSLVKTSTSTTLYGIDLYSINGVAAGSGGSGSGTTTVSTGVMLAASRSDINFDYVDNTLTFKPAAVRLFYGSTTKLIAGQTVALPTASTGNWYNILYNTNSGNISLQRVTVTLATNEIVVGRIIPRERAVDGIPYYTEQNKEVSSVKSNLKTANFLVPYGNVESDYEQPELPEYLSMHSANSGDYNKFYALYDALVTAYPSYVKKTTLGTDALGNPIHQYQFTTPDVPTLSATTAKAKVVIISGVHGGEKAGIYNVYFALKQIIERWKDDAHLAALYWGINFIVVPIANPSGYNANTRWNHNTVDIARNFAADWTAALVNGGTAPFSEPETVILDAVLSNNSDAVYVCSHHNFGDNTSQFIWNASATYFSRNLAKNLIIAQTIRAKKRYSWMPQADNYYIGYTDLGQPGGSVGRQAVDKYGMNASTFEISSSFAWESGMPVYSSVVATIGVETFINWLLMNIKYAPQIYNTKINL